jgi:Ca2+-binding RTX toxin-like protein
VAGQDYQPRAFCKNTFVVMANLFELLNLVHEYPNYISLDVVGSRLAVSLNGTLSLIDPPAPNPELVPTTASVSLAGGVLRVFGTSGADNIRIYQHTTAPTRLMVQLNGVKHSFKLDLISRIKIYGYGGDDQIAFIEKYGKLGLRTNVDVGAGDDLIYTGGGRDTIDAGLGDDTVASGNNDDAVNGGNGDDSIVGGNGNDTISGGDGSDYLAGNRGNDQRGGGDDQSPDTIDGNDGVDVLFGQAVIDVFFAGTGRIDPNDVILE